MSIIIENIWLILFFAWGLPLTYYRSKFRKIVYQTDSWTINIKPYFWKELKALFGNMYPDNRRYLKLRNFYRFYLVIYLLLFAAYLTFNKDNHMNEIKVGSTIPAFGWNAICQFVGIEQHIAPSIVNPHFVRF